MCHSVRKKPIPETIVSQFCETFLNIVTPQCIFPSFPKKFDEIAAATEIQKRYALPQNLNENYEVSSYG